jgi:hypothetical protein
MVRAEEVLRFSALHPGGWFKAFRDILLIGIPGRKNGAEECGADESKDDQAADHSKAKVPHLLEDSAPEGRC